MYCSLYHVWDCHKFKHIEAGTKWLTKCLIMHCTVFYHEACVACLGINHLKSTLFLLCLRQSVQSSVIYTVFDGLAADSWTSWIIINSLLPGVCVIFNCVLAANVSRSIRWAQQANVTGPHHCWVSTGPGNGLVLPGNKPLSEPVLTKIYAAIRWPSTCNIFVEYMHYRAQCIEKCWLAWLPKFSFL